MEVVSKGVLLIALSAFAFGADFTLAVGSPVAASLPQVEGTSGGAPVTTKLSKGAVLAVRGENCADAAKAQITATAEGLVNGARQSVPLHLAPGAVPGVYVVSREWPLQGVWVVNLGGVCAGAKAGALVPMGPGGFSRESSKSFPRSATEAEIETSLNSLAGGSR